MITDTFDDKSQAIINPSDAVSANIAKCDVCIVTFSNEIEDYVINHFDAKKVGEFKCVNGVSNVYIFNANNKTFGIYKTLLGAPASVGVFEEVNQMLDTHKFLAFGSAGTLDNERCHNKVMVPTYAYRDEGTSYHYAKASDYIEIKNAPIVADFMERNKIPYVLGKCWTTDGFYRETKNNFAKRKADGCIAVDMECSALQAVCDFRKVELYYFLLSGDVLDTPEWEQGNLTHANHDIANFEIALHLAQEL